MTHFISSVHALLWSHSLDVTSVVVCGIITSRQGMCLKRILVINCRRLVTGDKTQTDFDSGFVERKSSGFRFFTNFGFSSQIALLSSFKTNKLIKWFYLLIQMRCLSSQTNDVNMECCLFVNKMSKETCLHNLIHSSSLVSLNWPMDLKLINTTILKTEVNFASKCKWCSR